MMPAAAADWVAEIGVAEIGAIFGSVMKRRRGSGAAVRRATVGWDLSRDSELAVTTYRVPKPQPLPPDRSRVTVGEFPNSRRLIL